MASATAFYDFKPADMKGQPYDFSQLKGKVVLVVNVASKCVSSTPVLPTPTLTRSSAGAASPQ